MIHRDEVHGDILYDDLAVALLDTPQLQRLGRVYQLGFGHLVYRGGNHTRLSHAMGTYLTAASLARALRRNYEAVEAGGALPQGAIAPEEFLPWAPSAGDQSVLSSPPERREIEDRWTVLQHLVCWAALLHDIGHVPLGHTLEDEFDEIYERHDAVTSPRLRHLWLNQGSDIRRVLTNRELYPPAFKRLGVTNGQDVLNAVLLICTWKERIDAQGQRTSFRELLEEEDGKGIAPDLLLALDAVDESLFQPLMADLVANTISADYLDYLRRDPHNLGLDVLRDARIVSRFWVGRDHLKQPRMALALVDRRGQERLDTCTSVVELVRQRFRFAEIVYYHKTKVAASAMLAKVFHLLEKPPELPQPRTVISIGDADAVVNQLLAAKPPSRAVRKLIDESTPKSLLDPEVGDEGLDGILRGQAFKQLKDAVRDEDRRQALNAVRGIALLDGLARRRLYKTSFTMNAKSFFKLKEYSEDHAPEHELTEFIKKLRGDSAARERIEQEMVEAAGWPSCAILLYVPGRKSQAKGIETGALSKGAVETLSRHPAVKDEVDNLNKKYEGLWRCIVLVHPDYATDSIGLSAAIDAFVSETFPETDPKNHGVVHALCAGAWFNYVEERFRTAATEFSELIGGEVSLTQWEAFDEFGDRNEPCTPRQHSLGASLATELSINQGATAAVEQIANVGDASKVEELIDGRVSAASGSLQGELDDHEGVRALQLAIETVAAEIKSGGS